MAIEFTDFFTYRHHKPTGRRDARLPGDRLQHLGGAYNLLALVPVGQGMFRALLGDLALTKPTRQPLYDGARAMLALGYDPDTVVQVRHAGTIACSGVVGELARWWIEERDRGGLRKVLWKSTREGRFF